MEDQGKRLLLAVAIAFAIMLAWTMLFPPDKPSEAPPEKDEIAEKGKPSGNGGTEADSKPAESETPAPVAPAERGEERFFDFDNEQFHARFSSYDGALVSWTLKGERLVSESTGEPEDLVRTTGEARPLRISFRDSTFDIPQGAEWRGEKVGQNEVHFTWSSSELKVVKRLKILPDLYAVDMSVSVELVGADEAEQALAVELYSAQDPETAEEAGWMNRVERQWKAACFQDDEVKTRTSGSLAKKGRKERSGSIYWGGFDHAYLLAALSIKDSAEGPTNCNAFPVPGLAGGMGVELVEPGVRLRKGEPALKRRMVAYFGPKYMDRLDTLDEEVGFTTKLNEAIDFGFFGILAAPLLSLLKWFQSWAVNWGLAIILLTLLVKGLTLPVTHRSMKSMQAMSKLKPQLEALREKFKDDRQRLNVETMALFKAHKVNPMGGCLPMLLQMPIWFALYRALTVAAELYQAPFIPGWMDDLTRPDPYHIMPVLLTGMMFLQTRLTPSTATGAQQKILMYGMPIMFGVFSFFFPAGLTLYIFTNTCLTAVHHLYLHKDARQEARDKKRATGSEMTTPPQPEAAALPTGPSGDDAAAKGSGESQRPARSTSSGKKSSSGQKGKRRKKKRSR